MRWHPGIYRTCILKRRINNINIAMLVGQLEGRVLMGAWKAMIRCHSGGHKDKVNGRLETR